MRVVSRLRPVALSLALLLALWASPVQAHKVNVFALVESGRIQGEGYFGGGGKAMNVPVEVLDAGGAVVATATTDAQGAFSLPVPAGAKAPLTVVLKAGDGHRNTFSLSAKDLGQDSPAPAVAPSALPTSPPVPGPATAPASASASGPAPGPASAPAQLDEARLAELVRAATAAAVEERLAPLRQQIARLTEQDNAARLRDIIGGVGWIVGLVGIAAWFKRPRGKE